ncbi:hypothetical protein AAHA92_15958 [Salvia divinorum]
MLLFDMNIPDQTAFFYNGNWSAESAQELQTTAGVIFSEVELSDRVQFMRSRYTTFKDVLRHCGAWWDFPSKSIIASDEVWEKIIKKNSFAGAYYYKEEPLYSKLACLFGMDDVKVEGAKEVIVISETNEVILIEDLKSQDLGEHDEKVNSPAIFPRPTVRRKLFECEAEIKDRESTTELGIYFIDLAPDGQLCTRMEKGREFAKHPIVTPKTDGPGTRSPHASSCGSNSPIGWWPHLFK